MKLRFIVESQEDLGMIFVSGDFEESITHLRKGGWKDPGKVRQLHEESEIRKKNLVVRIKTAACGCQKCVADVKKNPIEILGGGWLFNASLLYHIEAEDIQLVGFKMPGKPQQAEMDL